MLSTILKRLRFNMQADFWHQRWESNQIGFHLESPHPLLVQTLAKFALGKQARIFVPLCGKTVDIAWLLAQGYQVVAAELSALAVQQLFAAMQVTPSVTTVGTLQCYQADQLTVYVGDIFQLDKQTLGVVNLIYDRAALIALPDKMREAYVQHLMQISDTAAQLLITIEYDQKLLQGPPFAIHQSMVQDYYQPYYQVGSLLAHEIEGGLKGQCKASEHVWQLAKKHA